MSPDHSRDACFVEYARATKKHENARENRAAAFFFFPALTLEE
jgi:hypothetical protein